MTSVRLLGDITACLCAQDAHALRDLGQFRTQVWFWKAIVQRELLRFLEFAVEPTLAGTAENLLYAYTYSGTMEGIIRLTQGLFGQASRVTIADETPAVIDLQIENANTYFLYALAQQDYTLAIEQRFAAATSDLAAVVRYDPLQFFRQFLTPGRVLRALRVSTREAQHAD